MKSLQSFVRDFPVKKFARGEIILCEGEVPTSAYVIKSGIIKSYGLTSEGLEKPLTLDNELDIFPIGWVFGKIKHSQYFHEAYTNSEVYVVTRDALVKFIRSKPDVLYDMAQSFIDEYLNFQMRINALEQSKASEKVLHTVHYLCLRYGKDIKADTVRIQLPLTQQEMANIMGLTRETTGIELKKLEKAGVIEYRRQNYIVKTNKLNELLDEDYTLGIIRT